MKTEQAMELKNNAIDISLSVCFHTDFGRCLLMLYLRYSQQQNRSFGFYYSSVYLFVMDLADLNL